MKKKVIVKLLCVLVLSCPLFSQESPQQPSDQEDGSGSEQSPSQSIEQSSPDAAGVSDALKLIEDFSAYIDREPLSFAEADFEEKLFDSMKKIDRRH